jgi:oxygen-independent coproporphyrinogen-3 oxidase
MKKELLQKYDLPIPRYTSYPTVPYWENNIDTQSWVADVKKTLKPNDSSWSMYLHIPFCESLCTFCGCNTIITKNHHLENPYLESMLYEWELYLKALPELAERKLKHIHLGGGTPTFLSSESLKSLLSRLFKNIKKTTEHFEASVEVDPRRTSIDQLKTLKDLGFNRVSMGVQDFDPEVQRLINRVQPFAVTEKLVNAARELGYRSVNFDLIYGLAKQTNETMRTCAELTVKLRPDRIALYSFALVPWIKPAQRLFKDEDLPSGAEKRELYEIAREIFLKAGYLEIGMDHFALPEEDLSIAMKNKSLHRNFMGYTDQKTDLLLALGVSGISQTPTAFHQNEKLLVKYENLLKEQKLPTLKGHSLNNEDIKAQRQILDLITQLEVKLSSPEQIAEAQSFLQEMLSDNLVSLQGNVLRLTEEGKPFLRNACTFFDERLKKQKPDFQIFSRSI